MRGKRNTKVRREPMPTSASPAAPTREMLQEHNGIKIGDRVFINFSLTVPRYNVGLVKEIYVHTNDKVIFVIWDEDKGMWRNLDTERIFIEKPIHNKRDK